MWADLADKNAAHISGSQCTAVLSEAWAKLRPLRINCAVKCALINIQVGKRENNKKVIELAVSHFMTVATNLEALNEREQN